jgi:hypothetical protein
VGMRDMMPFGTAGGNNIVEATGGDRSVRSRTHGL